MLKHLFTFFIFKTILWEKVTFSKQILHPNIQCTVYPKTMADPDTCMYM